MLCVPCCAVLCGVCLVPGGCGVVLAKRVWRDAMWLSVLVGRALVGTTSRTRPPQGPWPATALCLQQVSILASCSAGSHSAAQGSTPMPLVFLLSTLPPQVTPTLRDHPPTTSTRPTIQPSIPKRQTLHPPALSRVITAPTFHLPTCLAFKPFWPPPGAGPAAAAAVAAAARGAVQGPGPGAAASQLGGVSVGARERAQQGLQRAIHRCAVETGAQLQCRACGRCGGAVGQSCTLFLPHRGQGCACEAGVRGGGVHAGGRCGRGALWRTWVQWVALQCASVCANRSHTACANLWWWVSYCFGLALRRTALASPLTTHPPPRTPATHPPKDPIFKVKLTMPSTPPSFSPSPNPNPNPTSAPLKAQLSRTS